MLTKEDYEKAVKILEEEPISLADIANKVGALAVIDNLIEEHFDPQPYTFRELNKGMWIWDDKENRADKIFETFEADFGVPYIKFDGAFEEMRTIVEFEVNRFFPLTKAM